MVRFLSLFRRNMAIRFFRYFKKARLSLVLVANFHNNLRLRLFNPFSTVCFV